MSKNYLVWQHIELPPEQQPLSEDINPRHEINLNHTGLPKEETEQFGLKIATTWYAEYDEANGYQTPLAKVDRQITFEIGTGLPNSILKSLSFKFTDGTWSDPETWREPIRKPKKFLKVMRGRAIDELEDLASKFELRERILDLYEQYQAEIALFIDAGSPRFRDAIASSTDAWLDETIPATGNKPRDVITQYASIGLAK